MTIERGIAVQGQHEGALTISDLENSFAIAVRQRELLEQYIKDRLTPGKHFYRIQGSKNSLTKEGAELICLPHGYRPSYFKEGGPDQPTPDDTPYQITVRCQLRKGDIFAGEGIGSASSYQTKKDGTYKPRQNDPGLCHNATLKMAQKSAYVAATLNATAASEFFTQDLDEDVAHEAKSDVPQDSALMCPIHKTEWFKRGKMRNFAHPIGDTKEWCNQEDAQRAKDAHEAGGDIFPPEPAQTAPASHPEAAAATPKSMVELWNMGLKLGYKNKAEMLAAIGVKDDALIGDLAEAWKALQEGKK